MKINTRAILTACALKLKIWWIDLPLNVSNASENKNKTEIDTKVTHFY